MQDGIVSDRNLNVGVDQTTLFFHQTPGFLSVALPKQKGAMLRAPGTESTGKTFCDGVPRCRIK